MPSACGFQTNVAVLTKGASDIAEWHKRAAAASEAARAMKARKDGTPKDVLASKPAAQVTTKSKNDLLGATAMKKASLWIFALLQ